MQPTTIRTLGVLAGALVTGVLAEPAPPGDITGWRATITPVHSPAGESSAQPQLTVSPRGVLLSWLERAGARATLKFAERTANGWTTAGTVASGDDWFVNWADVPSVLRLDDGTLAAHWLQKSGPSTYAYDVRLSYSRDEGRSWSAPFTPHHDGTHREHGFASLFQMPGTGLGLVWLDGRAMTSADGHGAHGADAGAMSVRFAAFDRGWTQTHDEPIDLRVCECCPTSAVVTSEGPLVAFRDRSDEEIRDIHVARRSSSSWGASRTVHDDRWRIAACPVNGPGLSARGNEVAVAWFTAAPGEGHAFAAFSSDAGRTFGRPIRLDARSALGRVDVALLADGSAVATWVEFADKRSAFVLRRVTASGRASALQEIASVDGGRVSGYPRLAHHGRELVLAWTEAATSASASRVRTAVVPLAEP